MFTRPVLARLASADDWRESLRFLEVYGLLRESSPKPLLGLFSDAWAELVCGYRNEYVYKNEITNRQIFGIHSPRTAALHIEFPVASSIVDVAVFNGTSTAYEIKTQFDSAKRIKTQTVDYQKTFEFVYVVSDPADAEAYASDVPMTVGVYALKKSGSLSLIKPATSNLDAMSKMIMFRCLRRKEYTDLLFERLGVHLDFPNSLISEKCCELFCSLDMVEAHSFFVNALKKRRHKLHCAESSAMIPPSLRALFFATPLSDLQQRNLRRALAAEVPVTISL